MDKKIICKSHPNGTGSNFSVKLPETLNIPPNSEICLFGGKVTCNFTYDVNSQNDTFCIQLGSFDGHVLGAQVPFKSLPPFLVKLPHGTYTTRAHIGQDDSNIGLLPTVFLDAINDQIPYKCFSFQGSYTANNRFGIFGENRDFDMDKVPVLRQYNNVNDITFGVNGNVARISDTVGGYTFISKFDMVVPAPNQIKDESIKITIPQSADIERLFFGYAFEEQITYRNNEEYNIDKDWVGLINEDVAGQGYQEGPSALSAEFYQNRLPLSVEVVNDVLKVVTFELGDDGLVDIESRVEIDTGVDVTAQPTQVNCGFDFNNTGDQIINFLVKITNSATAADLGTTTILVPTFLFGHTFKFGCCIDSGQNIDIDLQLLDTDALAELGTELSTGDGTFDEIFGAAGASGNLVTTFVFNTIPKDLTIATGSPEYVIGSALRNLSKKCNFDFFMGGSNYDTVPGDAETGDETEFQFNDSNSTSNGIAHVQILNLPIENYICSPVSGNPINLIHSFRYQAANSMNLIEPYNLIYTKLTNKSDITINTLDIRLVNSDGSIINTTINASELWFHLKEGKGASNALMNKVTENSQTLQDYFNLVLKKLS